MPSDANVTLDPIWGLNDSQCYSMSINGNGNFFRLTGATNTMSFADFQSFKKYRDMGSCGCSGQYLRMNKPGYLDTTTTKHLGVLRSYGSCAERVAKQYYWPAACTQTAYSGSTVTEAT